MPSDNTQRGTTNDTILPLYHMQRGNAHADPSAGDAIPITDIDSESKLSLLQRILSYRRNNGDDRYQEMRFRKSK